MKKFLLTAGLALTLSLPVYSVQAQFTVTRQDAVEWIQTPPNSEPLSEEDADGLLAEWEAATLENGTIANEDGTISPEYLPEDLTLDEGGITEILTYLEEFRVNEENPEEEGIGRIDRPRSKPEPGLAELGLVRKGVGRPLGGRPDAKQGDADDGDDLTPENTGGVH